MTSSGQDLCTNPDSLEDFDKSSSLYSKLPRTLSSAEREKLEKDKTVLSDFKQNKLELEAHKNWDKFYKRNTTKFFKDRHWTKREFQELCGNSALVAGRKTILLEVGCGVGNFIFPLLDGDHTGSLFIYACDFSPRAVDFVKENPLYEDSRCSAFVCDVVTDPLTNHIPCDTVDIATLIFVLSAIHPAKMQEALVNIHRVLRPGGTLLFRDYGLYDHAMLRFASGHKLGENFYVRQDGTRAYYFSTDVLENLTQKAGFQTVEMGYVQRETVNKKEDLCVPRIFVQAKFLKKTCEEFSTSRGQTLKEINVPPDS